MEGELKEKNKPGKEKRLLLQRFPEDVLFHIFTKLDSSEDIYALASVFKRCRGLLPKQANKSIYLPNQRIANAWQKILRRKEVVTSFYSPGNNIVRSPAFLVHLSNSSKRGDPGEDKLCVIDLEGRLRSEIKINYRAMQIDNEYRWWTCTSNGMFCMICADDKDSLTPSVYAGNAGVKRCLAIPSPLWDSFIYDGFNKTGVSTMLQFDDCFHGVWFDENKCIFTLVLGFMDEWEDEPTAHVFIYNSKSDKWKLRKLRINSIEVDLHDLVSRYYFVGNELGKGVFYEGCFFWVFRPYYDDIYLLYFSLAEAKISAITLPQYSHDHDHGDGDNYWRIKGCDDHVFVVCYNARHRTASLWRLLGNEKDGFYVERVDNVNISSKLNISTELDFYGDENECFNLVGKEWWMIQSGSKLEIVNSSGKTSGPLSLDALSTHPKIMGIWPYELNNICWLRA